MDIERFTLNHQLFYLINHRRHPLLDVFYAYFHLLGKGSFGLFVGFILLFTGDKGFFKYAVAVNLQALVVKLLKYTIRAKRPSTVLEEVYLLEKLRLKSFPSGDTAMSTVIALCLFEGAPVWLKPALVVYPILIGYGRVYMGVHFPLDVVAGWTIGVVCYLGVSYFF